MTPALLDNIQSVRITNLDDAAAHSISLLNANAVEEVVNDASLYDLTFNNVGATATFVGVENTARATTVNYATTTGAQEIELGLSNVTGAAAVTIAGVETVNILSENAANSVDLELAAATTLTIDGDANLTVAPLSAGGNTIKVSSVDASNLTGNLTLDMGAQSGVLSTTDISVTGGQGNDTITMSAISQDYVVTLGAGNDTVVDTNISNTRSIEGGEGTDTLSTDDASARGLTTVNGINGIDVVKLTDALSATLTTANVDSTVNTVTLAASAGALTSGTAAITGPAGELTVNLGSSVGGALGSDLTLTDTGTATTDVLNINNLSISGSTQVNAFGTGRSITSAGYENVNINTGSASPVAQTIADLTITADAASANVSLNLEGQSPVEIALVATNSTGVTTIDASGLNVLTANNGLTLSNTSLGGGSTLGTESIIGSAGVDSITVGAYASTIDGGAGNDTLNGNTKADSIHGGAGDDVISGGGGNDTLKGGEGNDAITETTGTATRAASIDGGAGNDSVTLGSTLVTTDVVNGGEGVDTLSVTSANITATQSVGVSNFEALVTTGNQTMTEFVNNSGWTSVQANANTGVTIANASSTLNTFRVGATADTGSASFDRLVDTGTDSLTLANYNAVSTVAAGSNTLTSFTANDEESLTIDVSHGSTTQAGNLSIDTLNVADITSLTLTGDHSVTIGAIVGGEDLATINASGMSNSSATVSVDASGSAVDMTVTGGTARFSSLQTGSGDDSVTGSSGADTIWTNNGDDTVVANGGNDIIRTDGGSDVISAGTGADTITAGTGADSVTLSVDGTGDQVTQVYSDSVAASTTAFANATVASGDSMTFGNGVDVVNDFVAGTGGDVLQVLVGAALPTDLVGATVANLSATNAVFAASGTYNAATGKFTISAAGVGPDTMIIQSTGSGTTDSLLTNASGLILVGVDATDFVTGNFVGGATAIYTIAEASTVTTLTGAISGGAVSAANLLSQGYTTISGGTIGAGNTLAISGTGETANQTFNFNTGAFTGATNSSVNTLIYDAVDTVQFGNGTNTYTSNTVATGTTTVTGGTGLDTLAYTGGAATINLVTSTVVGSLENINASAATGAVTATLDTDSTVYTTSASADDVTLADAAGNAVTVNAAALANDITLTLKTGGAGDTVTVNNLVGNLSSSSGGTLMLSSLVVNLADNTSDNDITVALGSGNATVTGGVSGDTVTIDATELTDGAGSNRTLTLGGAAVTQVNALNTGDTNALVSTSSGATTVTANVASANDFSVTNNGSGIITIDSTGTAGAGDNDVTLGGSGRIDVTALDLGVSNGIDGIVIDDAATGTFNVNFTVTGTHGAATALNSGAAGATLADVNVNAQLLGAALTITGANAVEVTNLVTASGSIAAGSATGAISVTSTDAQTHQIVTGSAGDTVTTGGSGTAVQTIATQAGADTITLASGGADIVLAGTGADTIVGSAGADVIQWGSDTTTIAGITEVISNTTYTGYVGANADAIGMTSNDVLTFDISAFDDQFVLLDGDGTTATAAGGVRAVASGGSATTLAADTNVIFYEYGYYSSAAAAQTAVQTAATRIDFNSTSTAASNGSMLIVWDQGASSDLAVGLVTFAAGQADSAIATVTQIATLTGVADFTQLAAANFNFVA